MNKWEANPSFQKYYYEYRASLITRFKNVDFLFIIPICQLLDVGIYPYFQISIPF